MAQLIDYETNETIREATADEARESAEAATRDGGAGVIRVDGVRCYVPEESCNTDDLVARQQRARAAEVVRILAGSAVQDLFRGLSYVQRGIFTGSPVSAARSLQSAERGFAKALSAAAEVAS